MLDESEVTDAGQDVASAGRQRLCSARIVLAIGDARATNRSAVLSTDMRPSAQTQRKSAPKAVSSSGNSAAPACIAAPL
jgi:hypothetical protein